VRAEYRKLVDELPALAADFGGLLSPTAQEDVATFTFALECIDRALDSEMTVAARRALAERILSALRGGAPAAHVADDDELGRWLLQLRALIVGRQIAAPFLALATRALANTERMRTTRALSEYLRCVEEEGRLTVEMTLTVMGGSSCAPLAAFLRGVAEIGNLYDKLVDARADAARGEIAIRPDWRLHAALSAALLRRLPRAIALHPRRTRFLRWALGWVVALPLLAARRTES
jgi:hypothetical protein